MIPILKSNKGLSEVVAYVMLISISIALSVLVFNWLRFYVNTDEVVSCPAEVALVIRDYNCTRVGTLILNMTLQNKGLFTVDGYFIRINDRENATVGIYNIEEIGDTLAPNEEINKEYSIDKEKITFLEVQPFIFKEGQMVQCQQSFQDLNCQ